MFYQGSKKLVFLRKKKKTKDKKGSEKLFLSVHNEPVVPLSGSCFSALTSLTVVKHKERDAC